MWNADFCSSRSPVEEEKDQAHIAHSAAEIRDVFGDSDDEDVGAVQNDIDQDSNVSIYVMKAVTIYIFALVIAS